MKNTNGSWWRDKRVAWRAACLAFALTGCGGGGGYGGGMPQPYTIGGTIAGLTAAGLVLANGNDTVSPAAGATSFEFATALASGSSYAVTVMTQPKNGLCQVANGSGQVGTSAVTNIMVTCARAWTWVGGADKINSNGVYGTQGAAATGNVPGARSGSVSWTDSAGNLWLFGGGGLDSAGNSGSLNDLWRYSPATGQWTWVSGSNTINATGVYGTKGMPAAGNVPGAREGSVSWTDSAGNLWLFGGGGYDSAGTQGDLNDLWHYSVSTDQWTWVSGSITVGAKGMYGTLSMAAVGNVPGARSGSVSWTDSAGNLWLFGGGGLDSAGNSGSLNDLWRYSPATGQWTWVSGSNTVNATGVYGTKGMPAAGNIPGARPNSVSWIDTAGNLWLFGGGPGFRTFYNDLWRYSPATGLWTWVGGSSTTNAVGEYGTQGVAAPGNGPGARVGSTSWTDSAGDLWLLGGYGSRPSPPPPGGPLEGLFNDLWRYSPATGQWTWVSGSSTTYAEGVYGTQGMAAAGNVPGAREDLISWTDSTGDLWLFGGHGMAAGAEGELNDLWVF
jgi:N-acetylneuraminic acid mutarotase